ncbi:MAG: nitrous oxide reductase accessory protein NosL [Acidobacteria bacterium]|nr:nitrous oxide reductase accessory protein NosL [Acidobacteriota bacterium]
MCEVKGQSCRIVILLAVCLLFNACAKREPTPVEIAPEDMCAFCRMAISERRFAAEIITRDGDALKFDDIGCMLDYLKGKENQGRIAVYFVADFETREWVRGEVAFYARSAEFKTPMSHGIAAFKDQGRAETAANNYKGRLMRFSELASK